jgi:hypothetical protein
MRFAIGATAFLAAAVVRADEESSSSSEVETSTSSAIAKPTFTVRVSLHIDDEALLTSAATAL